MTSRTSEKDKPTRPLNGYFRYRIERLKEMPDDDKNRSKKIKIEWDELDQKEKDKLAKTYENEMAEYKEEMEKWEKKHGIKKSKSKKRSASKKDRDRSASAKKGNKKK